MKSGYLINIENPNFSGFATLTFCSEKPEVNPPKAGTPKFAPKGEVETVYTEAGFGVRQLAAALGRNFEHAGPHTRLEYSVDSLGVLEYFVVAEDEPLEDPTYMSADPEIVGRDVR